MKKQQIQRNKVTEYLDGNLISLLRQLYQISSIKSADYISVPDLTETIYAHIILNSRKDKLNWLWTSSEITYDKEFKEYILPSVDLNGLFEWTGHSNIKEWIKTSHGIELSCLWDTEFSAWYPKFKAKKDALTCIKVFNSIFDSEYLPTLKTLVATY